MEPHSIVVAPAVVWHYTVQERLQHILTEGVIRPAPIAGLHRVKPAVWFTTQSDWDPMANRLWQNPQGRWVRLNKDQTIVLFGGLSRIAVPKDVAPLDWKAYREKSGLPSKVSKAIYDEAVTLGSRPGQWFAAFDSVPREKWLSVELWEEEAWVHKAGF